MITPVEATDFDRNPSARIEFYGQINAQSENALLRCEERIVLFTTALCTIRECADRPERRCP